MTSTASVNARAWAIPFCPVCASRTRSVSSTVAAGLLDHALDLRELVHQRLLRVQPPRRVDDQDVAPRARADADRVERDRAGSAPRSCANEVRPGAFAPRPRAARPPRRGTCRRRRALTDLPSRGEPLGELADRRGLARSVDAHHEDHREPAAPRCSGLVGAEDREDLPAEQVERRRRRRDGRARTRATRSAAAVGPDVGPAAGDPRARARRRVRRPGAEADRAGSRRARPPRNPPRRGCGPPSAAAP